MNQQIEYKNVFYPPGGLLLWMIIALELTTFGIALLVMLFFAKEDPVLFHESRLQLNVTIGTINTVLLLTSGFFMANTVHELRQNNRSKAQRYLLLTMLFGLLFLVLKVIEYAAKIEAGLVMDTNDFFGFYWMLTFFHVIHVIVGLVILSTVLWGIRKANQPLKMEHVEGSAAFWHMCDLIWLLLFPVIYLIL